MKKLLRIALILFTLIPLGVSGQDLKEYYYNLEDYTTPKYFVYEMKDHPELNQYWKIHTDPENKILVTIAYNAKFEQQEFVKEQYTDSGAVLLQFDMFENNDIVRSAVVKSDVFKWEAKPGEYAYEINYVNQYGSNNMRKERKFRLFEEMTVLGKKMDVARLSSYYVVKTESYTPTRFSQFSYYAKGIGFVKFQRFFDEGPLYTLELAKIIEEEEWQLLKSGK